MLNLLFLIATQANVKAEIQKQYDAWSKAYMARDTEVLIGILSPDYKLTTSDGSTLGYGEYVAKLKLMKGAAADPTKYSTEIKRLTQRAEEASVIAVETMESKGVDPKSGKPATVLHRHEYLDTWIHYNAGWRLRRTDTKGESTSYRSDR